MIKKIILILCFVPLVTNAELEQLPAKGFHWYSAEEQEKEEIRKKEIAPPPAKASIEPYQELMESRNKIKNVLAEALLRPSFDSTKNYMQSQQQLAKRHQEFVRNWEKVLIVHPELDHTLNFPTDNTAIAAKNDTTNSITRKIIEAGSKKYGFILFYKGKSLISQKFVSALSPFIESNHFSMISVSTDGKAIKSLPQTKIIPLEAVKKVINLKERYMPALFLVDLKSNQMQPFSYGFVSSTALKERFLDIATNFKRFSYEGLGE